MRIKTLNIGFCDSCPYHRVTDGYSFCENRKEEIGETSRFVLIPEWCPLEDAKVKL
jgi:hypothetical protein